MFNSQVVEVAIALALLLFLISLIASGIVEIVSQLTQRRAADLEAAVTAMLGSGSGQQDWRATDTYRVLKDASKQRPSYMSAKTFADMVVELMRNARQAAGTADDMLAKLPEGLRHRVNLQLTKATGDLAALRGDAESWFDDIMDRVAGAYKRWAQAALFLTGFIVAVSMNASAFRVAERTWNDPVVRAAVTEAASGVVQEGQESSTGAEGLAKLADDVDRLDGLGLPIGWKGDSPRDWSVGDLAAAAVGYVMTALLVMLGAPFWFDLLTRLVALRAAGRKPVKAADDPTSVTAALVSDRGSPAGLGSSAIAALPTADLVAANGVKSLRKHELFHSIGA